MGVRYVIKTTIIKSSEQPQTPFWGMLCRSWVLPVPFSPAQFSIAWW